MSQISEVYMRAVQVALARGLTAKGTVCTFAAGPWEFTFNGTAAPHDSIPPLHLLVKHPGGFLPMAIVSPDGGTIAGGDPDEIEQSIINALRPESSDMEGG